MSGNSNTPISIENKSMDNNTFVDKVRTLSKALERLIELKNNLVEHLPLYMTGLNSLFDELIPQLNDIFSMFYHTQESSEEFNTLPSLVLKYLFVDTTLTPQTHPDGHMIVQADGTFIYDETHALTDRTVDPLYLSLVNEAMSLYDELELNNFSEQIIDRIQEWLGATESHTKSWSKC
jgi:hypothetical protein